jgi:hypothetical protein
MTSAIIGDINSTYAAQPISLQHFDQEDPRGTVRWVGEAFLMAFLFWSSVALLFST